MTIHKKTRLTPFQRQAIYHAYYKENLTVSGLARAYNVTRPTIYKIIRRGRLKDFSVHDSTNKRYRCPKYGMIRPAKVEKEIEERLKRRAKRYNKDYPGQLFHGDTKRLPLLEGQSKTRRGYR